MANLLLLRKSRTDLCPTSLPLLKASSSQASCAASDPMPFHPEARIRTNKSLRGLALDEFCRGLGYLKDDSSQVPQQMAIRTTPLFHWEFLASALSGCPAQAGKPRVDPLPSYPTPIPETPPRWTPPILFGLLVTSKREGNGSFNELQTCRRLVPLTRTLLS